MENQPSAPPTGEEPQSPSSRRSGRWSWLGKISYFYGNLNKWNKLALWLVLAAVPMAVLAYHFARPVYRSFKQANAMRMAERFIEEGDMASASMSFRRAIRTNPRNPDVWMRIGEFLEESGARETVDVYEQLAALEPNEAEHRYKVAETAIGLRRFNNARKALAAVSESDQVSPKYLRLKASLDLATGDFDSARKNLDTLAEFEGLTEADTFQRKLVDLHSGTIEERINASQWFDELAKGSSDQSAQAYRELIGYQVRSGNVLDANRLAARLIEHPDSRLQDHLSHVELELAAGSFTVPNTIQAIRQRAEANPEELPVIAMFLMRKLGTESVASWMDGLPESIATEDNVRASRLEIALAAGDINTALDMLENGSSGTEFPVEPTAMVRTAFDEFEAGESIADNTWTEVVSSVEGTPESLAILAGLAAANQWPEAQIKALWALVARAPQHRDSWLKLAMLERSMGNSAGLLQALEGLSRANPEDLAVRNDATLVRLLLRRGDPETMVTQAKTLIETEPDNPVYVTTYATALANSGRAEEAVEVINSLPPGQLNQRSRALYVGHIYARAGQQEEALAFLGRAQEVGTSLIPEERMLLTQAMNIATGRTATVEETVQQVVRSESSDEDRQRIEEEMRRQRDAAAGSSTEADIIESIRSQGQTRTPEELQKLLDEVRGTAESENADEE